tara:strand:+ start:374 stop:553 length:180 start_codon:yes stop_codon:yes gene_type:complete
MKTELNVIVNKTSLGYTLVNEEDKRIDYFNDDEEGRQALIGYLIEEIFNQEVKGGRKYK